MLENPPMSISRPKTVVRPLLGLGVKANPITINDTDESSKSANTSQPPPDLKQKSANFNAQVILNSFFFCFL